MYKHLNKLSEQLLLHVKLDKNVSEIRLELECFDFKKLNNSLINDTQKKAFWINIYNAFYQILREKEKVNKQIIYKKKLFTIAGTMFSLDDVEHGILRRYRYKYSLGFIANLFPPKIIKKLAVSKIDYRIHFALNCGAKSCPPIAFYTPLNLEEELNLATQSFLESETDFYPDKKEVHTTALFKWFLADFGGIKGIKNIFKTQLGKDISDYKIKYKEYSWKEDLANFKAEI